MKLIRIISLFFILNTLLHAFVGPTPFKEQIESADAVARIVVVQIAELKFADEGEYLFNGLAKCRVITDYTGALNKADFIYIPCDYSFDESPSPLEAGSDYIVSLEIMKHSSIAHPVSHDSLHEIFNSELEDPEAEESSVFISIVDFEAKLKKLLKAKAERMSTGEAAKHPESETKDSGDPKPESK